MLTRAALQRFSPEDAMRVLSPSLQHLPNMHATEVILLGSLLVLILNKFNMVVNILSACLLPFSWGRRRHKIGLPRAQY